MIEYKEKLESQIKDQYGKLVYSYTCHWEEVAILKNISNKLKWGDIALTAISATGIVSFFIFDAKWLAAIGAVFSTLSLAITLFSKEYNVDEKIISHQKSADDLWVIREKYLSLLTDIGQISTDEICKRRDELVEESAAIYKAALPTSAKAYERAQNKIKNEEYQFFTEDELDKMMPNHLRKQEGDAHERDK